MIIIDADRVVRFVDVSPDSALSAGWAVFGLTRTQNLAAYGVAVLTRALLAWRFHGRVGDAFLHPLGVVYLIAIGVNSARLAGRGGAVWKGRAVGSTRR